MPQYSLPIVSIITVCLNSEKYIEDAMTSVLNQSYPNIEYIIIDGQSKDNTLDLIKIYEPKFKGNMKWVSEKDNGIYDAMNKGIEISNGDIIGILNSDDWYEKDIIKLVVNKIGEYDMLHGKVRFVDVIGNTIAYSKYRKANKFNIIFRKPYLHPSMFVKRYVYDTIGCYNNNYKTSADYDFIMRLFYNKYKTVYLSSVVTNFRKVGITSVPYYNDYALIQHKSIMIENGIKPTYVIIIIIFKKLINKMIRLLKNNGLGINDKK